MRASYCHRPIDLYSLSLSRTCLSRLQDLTIVSQQEFVIYEEHEIQAWLTLNNRGTEQRSFTIPEQIIFQTV